MFPLGQVEEGRHSSAKRKVGEKLKKGKLSKKGRRYHGRVKVCEGEAECAQRGGGLSRRVEVNDANIQHNIRV